MYSKQVVFAIFTCILVCCTGIAQDLQSRLEKVGDQHPRLFIAGKGALEMDNFDSDASRGRLAVYVVDAADDIIEADPVERKKIGRRLLGVSRTCLNRVVYLASAYQLTGRKKYALRAREEMLAAAGFSDWNPSHFLDVAEMTAALAIGYDWCYDALQPAERQRIRTAIVEKGMKPYLKGGWWVKTHNNWNQVCHGGLSLGALAVADIEPELAHKVIARALEHIPLAMDEYAPDGAYPEGASYWAYGTTYNILLIDAFESVLGTDFGLSQRKGFMEAADYYLHVIGPTGLYFNYSDSGARARAPVAPAMYWFASKREKPSLLWVQQAILEECLAKEHSNQGGSARFLPMILAWGRDWSEVPPPENLDWRGRGDTPVGMHRSGWGEADLYLAVKGGTPRANHAHMDVGSFVFDADGVRWACDLGAQSYHGLESRGINLWSSRQDSDRWKIFRYANSSHNTLVVDGKKQVVAGFAPIISHSDEGPMVHTTIDMSTVYKGQLRKAVRQAGLWKRKAAIVRDEIETLDQNTTIRWGMVTRADVRIVDRHKAVLTRDGKELYVEVLSPDNATLQTFNTAEPRRDFDAPNKGTVMLGFEIDVPASSGLDISVLLAPDDDIQL